MKIDFTKQTLGRKMVIVLLLLVVTVLFAAEMAAVDAQQSQPCRDPIAIETWCYGWTTATYSFYGDAGNYVSIRMEKDGNSPGLDPYLELEDPHGYIVASDDDSLGNGNSLIDGYRLRHNGWHTIIARSHQNRTTGQFWLHLKIY